MTMEKYTSVEEVMIEWGCLDIWLALGIVTAPVPRWTIKEDKLDP